MKKILAMALASAAGLAFMTTPVNAASHRIVQEGATHHAGQINVSNSMILSLILVHLKPPTHLGFLHTWRSFQ